MNPKLFHKREHKSKNGAFAGEKNEPPQWNMVREAKEANARFNWNRRIVCQGEIYWRVIVSVWKNLPD